MDSAVAAHILAEAFLAASGYSSFEDLRNCRPDIDQGIAVAAVAHLERAWAILGCLAAGYKDIQARPSCIEPFVALASLPFLSLVPECAAVPIDAGIADIPAFSSS